MKSGPTSHPPRLTSPELLKAGGTGLDAARERLRQEDFLSKLAPRLPVAFQKALGFLRDQIKSPVRRQKDLGSGEGGRAAAKSKGRRGAAARTTGPHGAHPVEAVDSTFGDADSLESKLFELVQQLFEDDYESRPPTPGEQEVLSAQGKEFVNQLDPEERGIFLALHPDQRRLLLEQADPRAKLAALARASRAPPGPHEPMQLAMTVGQELVGLLGPAGMRDKAAQQKLFHHASSLTLNFLRETGGKLGAAKTRALRALLSAPEFTQPLLSGLEQALAQRQTALGKGDRYTSFFKKIRSTVPDAAQRLAHPALSHEELFGGLIEAIQASADYQATHPPRRRNLRAEKHVAFKGKNIPG